MCAVQKGAPSRRRSTAACAEMLSMPPMCASRSRRRLSYLVPSLRNAVAFSWAKARRAPLSVTHLASVAKSPAPATIASSASTHPPTWAFSSSIWSLSSPRNSAGPGSAGCRSAALSSSYGTKRSAWAWSRADSAAARSVAPNFMARGGDQRALRGELVTISEVVVVRSSSAPRRHLAPDRARARRRRAPIVATTDRNARFLLELAYEEEPSARAQRRRLAARERTCYSVRQRAAHARDAGRRRRPAAMNVPPGLGGRTRRETRLRGRAPMRPYKFPATYKFCMGACS